MTSTPVAPEPLHLDSRESRARVGRLFETFVERQDHALAVLDEPGLTRLERAQLATKMLQVLAGYRGRKPRDGDAGRPAIPGVAVGVMARRAQDIRAVIDVDGPAAGLADVQVRHEVARMLDLSWERLRQIVTGELGGGAARRRAPSDRPAGRPRIVDGPRAGRVAVPEPTPDPERAQAPEREPAGVEAEAAMVSSATEVEPQPGQGEGWARALRG